MQAKIALYFGKNQLPRWERAAATDRAAPFVFPEPARPRAPSQHTTREPTPQ
jgi:hypothetical protein